MRRRSLRPPRRRRQDQPKQVSIECCNFTPMFAALKVLLKQPYWVIALILGAALVVFPCVTIDKDSHWNPHQPSTLWPVVVGLLLLLLSSVGFALTFLQKRATGTDD